MAKKKSHTGEDQDVYSEPVSADVPAEPAPKPVIVKGGNKPGKVPPSLRGTSQDPSRKKEGG